MSQIYISSTVNILIEGCPNSRSDLIKDHRKFFKLFFSLNLEVFNKD